MPPAISTTSSPTAQMTLTALLLSRLVKLTSVRKSGEAMDSPAHRMSSTTSSFDSVG